MIGPRACVVLAAAIIACKSRAPLLDAGAVPSEAGFYADASKVERAFGHVKVTFNECVAEADGCTDIITHTCLAEESDPARLDCVASHARKKPSFLSALSMEGAWDHGTTSVMADDAGTRRFVIAAVPLSLWDGDVTSVVLEGPLLRGDADESGALVFDGPAAIAWDRAECAKVPPPSKAPVRDLWRSAVCARFLGKSVAWITEQWLARCEAPVDDAEAKAWALAEACRIDPLERRKGVPRRAADGLKGLSPF
jgi:hypothetical protein